MAENQEVPLEQIIWHDIPVTQLIAEGWRPHRKVKRDGSEYLTIRKGKQERSLGRYDAKKHIALKKILPSSKRLTNVSTPELIEEKDSFPKDNILEEDIPNLRDEPIKEEEDSSVPRVRAPQSTLLRTPIQRHVVFPKSYVPTIKVMRYFEILKESGFKGDFNEFINDIIETHFQKCHGIQIPVVYLTS